MPDTRRDVLVIGAGPAGMAAALRAAEGGADVALYDMQPEPGGQIWRGEWRTRKDPAASRWMSALERSSVSLHLGRRLIAVEDRRAFFDGADGSDAVQFERAIIATGARELLLPFAGWTLPGVFGAGGLQALAKNGWTVREKRVMVAGSGPLLLATAATLRDLGAHVIGIAEQAPWSALFRFAPAIVRMQGKLRQAFGLAHRLRGVPYHASTYVTAAHGDTALRSVTLRHADKSWQVDCDYLAAGYGLVPNLEVAQAFGCALRDAAVYVDADQRTSVPGVFCVGEGTGIGGVDQAVAQGEIAGFAGVGQAAKAQAARVRLNSARRFAAALNKHFSVGEAVLNDAGDAVLLCRCEDVSVGAARACGSLRAAKLHSRLGMGHCQGRVCGAAAAQLFGWSAPAPRLPLAPVSVAQLDFSSFSPDPSSTTP
jgi:NADPH-dependent 2,4-dienoyl-CoA reductase/sulfur reductase-like enzyme